MRLVQILFVTLPLLFALSISSAFDVHITRIYIPLATLLVVCVGLYRKKLKVPTGIIAGASLLLLLFVTMSLVYSEVPGWTARKVIYFWTFTPLVLLVYWALESRASRAISLIGAIVIGGAIAGSIGSVQFLLQFIIGRDVLEVLWGSLTPFFLGGAFSESVALYNSWFVHVGGRDVFRAIGFFPDPHVFAFYTGMILPFAYGLWRETKSIFWLVAGAVILIGNILTFSRGGEVGLLGGVVTAFVMSWKTLSTMWRHATLSFIIVFTLICSVPGNPLQERFFSSFSQADTSASSRIEIWSHALLTWSENPLLGVGLGAYPFAVDPQTTYRTPIYAHNLLLDIGVELGLLGAGLFVFLIGAMVWVFWRRRTVYGRCAIISLAIFLSHGIFDTPLFSVHVFPVLLFLIGLAIYYEQSTRSVQKTREI